MSTTQFTLDAATTALILIDLQYGIVARNVQPQSSAQVIARAKLLAQAFRAAHAPVVLVTVGGSPDGKDLLAPVADATPPPEGPRSGGRLGPIWTGGRVV